MGKSMPSQSSDSKHGSDREPLTATMWSELGNKLRSSDPDSALAAFQRAVQIDPNHLAAWLSIAELLVARGAKRDAEDAAKKVVALQPTDAEEIERLCMLLLLFGKEVDAERFGKRLLALNPEDKRSWPKMRSDLRARAMYRTTAPAAAVGASVEGVPQRRQTEAARTASVSADTQKQPSVAKQYTPSRASAIEATMPSQDLAAGRAAPLASQATKPPAPTLDQGSPQATATQDQKAAVARDQKAPQGETEITFRRLAEENPDSINAVKGLARSVYAQGKLIETMQVAEKGLALKPDDPELLYLLGSSALGTRNFSAARQFLERCTVVSPRSIEAWTDLGYCHICEGRANDAARALLSAIRIDPNNAKALVYFAKALIMQNQDERAASVLMKVLEIEKTSPLVLEKAAELLEQLGQSSAAMKARTRATTLRQQNP